MKARGSKSATEILGIVHSDVSGQRGINLFGGETYCSIFDEDFSREKYLGS